MQKPLSSALSLLGRQILVTRHGVSVGGTSRLTDQLILQCMFSTQHSEEAAPTSGQVGRPSGSAQVPIAVTLTWSHPAAPKSSTLKHPAAATKVKTSLVARDTAAKFKPDISKAVALIKAGEKAAAVTAAAKVKAGIKVKALQASKVRTKVS